MLCEENVHNRFRYTGQMNDSVSSHYYLRARFYNLVIGRFLQEDTYLGDGLNLFSYCKNNPLMYYEPSGNAGMVCPDKYAQWKKYKEQGLSPEEALIRTNADRAAAKAKSNGKVYYHVTTAEAAEKIMASGELGVRGNKWESRVFAWTQQPTERQASIAGIGKDVKTVLKFRTNASFQKDKGNKQKSISEIVVETTDGQRVPISIWDIEIVGFKKEWWEFWKK